MPTMILSWAWLLASTIPCSGPAPMAGPALSPAFAATIEAPASHPGWAGRVIETGEDQPGWLLFESDTDEEETDSDDDQGISIPWTSWAVARSPFGVVVSNPHPTVLACSALRSPTLRC